jgi:hypothetical protein
MRFGQVLGGNDIIKIGLIKSGHLGIPPNRGDGEKNSIMYSTIKPDPAQGIKISELALLEWEC